MQILSKGKHSPFVFPKFPQIKEKIRLSQKQNQCFYSIEKIKILRKKIIWNSSLISLFQDYSHFYLWFIPLQFFYDYVHGYLLFTNMGVLINVLIFFLLKNFSRKNMKWFYFFPHKATSAEIRDIRLKLQFYWDWSCMFRGSFITCNCYLKI